MFIETNENFLQRNGEILNRYEKHPFLNVPFLLVSGQGRSGTTVLTKAVGSHSAIYSNMKESNYIVDLVWSVMRACKMEHRRSQLAVTEQELQANFRNALWHTLFPIDGWRNGEGTPPAAVSTFSALRSEVADFLIEFLPNVHIVNIVRNGLEVVASRMAHEHIGKRSFREHCIAWAAAMDIIGWGKSNKQFSLIRHETFLDPDATAKTFRELFSTLELAQDDAPTQFVCGGLINTTRLENDTDQSVDDLANRKERWRSWTDSQRETFTEICRPAMLSLGYEMPW